MTKPDAGAMPWRVRTLEDVVNVIVCEVLARFWRVIMTGKFAPVLRLSSGQLTVGPNVQV